MHKPWKRIEPTIVSKIGYRTIVSKTFSMPNGKVAHFQISDTDNSHAGAVIAITKDKKVVIARQFRPGPEKFFNELPGGGINEQEGFQTGAMRELLEETGYTSTNVRHLGDVYKSAYIAMQWHYFLALDCELDPRGPELEENEYVEVSLISITELVHNAMQGSMTDTEAVLLAYDILKTLNQEA